jgi:glycine dehydrogenase subunit 1
MDFVSNREPQIAEMLASLGLNTLKDLFIDIPQELILPPPSGDDGLSEYEGIKRMEAISRKNTFPSFDQYLGAGAYEHHIPALASFICQKSEFLTSYTPYQAEVSQGMLQIIFEFQSAICALTGLDAANASLYDGASACAEALLMSLRHHKSRQKLLISHAVHPHYRAVVDQYLKNHQLEIITIPTTNDGLTDIAFIKKHLDDHTAAILMQSPNFFGCIEEIKIVSEMAKKIETLTILCANPLSYGLYESAAELHVDIAVGDCQPLGLPLNYGGPYAGYIACTENLIRQLPGRIVGETTDTNGHRGFVLTLQAREQHIRREKATSNICTNQALAALSCLITTLWYGRQGLHELALTNYQRAAYLKQHLETLPGIKAFSKAPHFNEFTIKCEKPIDLVIAECRKHGIEPGINLGEFYPEYQQCLLIAVTETKSLQQLQKYIATFAQGGFHAH